MNVVTDNVDLIATITKVPVICHVGAAVVIRVECVDSACHRPLVAVSLLTIQPDLNTRQLLNDLYNHRVRRARTQPVAGRHCRQVANQLHTLVIYNSCWKLIHDTV